MKKFSCLGEMLSIVAIKRQVTSIDMICSRLLWSPTMARHIRRSCTTCEDNNIWSVHLLPHASYLMDNIWPCTYKFRDLFCSLLGSRANCLTLGESEDPVSTMSTEHPGKSSTRGGLTLNKDLRPEMSFFLGAEIGGRTVRPEKFTLRVFVEGRESSVSQYNRCLRLPWLVSLKWYWHDSWLILRKGRVWGILLIWHLNFYITVSLLLCPNLIYNCDLLPEACA